MSTERLAEEVFPAQERQRFWNRFYPVAALNGYSSPVMETRNRDEAHGAIVDRCRPTAFAIGLLTLAWIPMQQNQANASDYRVEVWPGSYLPLLSFSRYPM